MILSKNVHVVISKGSSLIVSVSQMRPLRVLADEMNNQIKQETRWAKNPPNSRYGNEQMR